MQTSASLRIGYLPFYVDYYEAVDPNFRVEKTAACGRVAEMLCGFGEVIWAGEMITNESQATAAGLFCAHQSVDCLVIYTSIAVFSAIPLAALKEVRAPVLLCNVQQIETLEGDYTAADMLRNTGQIGIQALANTLLREDRAFHVVTGFERSTRLATEIKSFLKLIEVSRKIRSARLLAIGAPFPAMLDVLIDEGDLKKTLGIEVTHVDSGELARRIEAISPAQVTARVAGIREQHAITDITDDEVRRSVRLAEAVEELVQHHHAAGGSLNCHGTCLRNSTIGVTACYSLGEQTARGRPFTCTGDLPTTVAMLLLKELTGVSLYTEIQIVDEKRDAVLLANSGEGEPGICRTGSKCALRGNGNFKGVAGRGLSYFYPWQNGPATVMSFTPTPKGRKPYRIVVAEGQVLEETPKSVSLAAFFRFRTTPLTRAYTRWLEAGPVHHAATTVGHWADELAKLADHLDLEFVRI